MLFRPIFRKTVPHFFRLYFPIKCWWDLWQVSTTSFFVAWRVVANNKVIIIIMKRKCFWMYFFCHVRCKMRCSKVIACFVKAINKGKNPSDDPKCQLNFACYISSGEICKFQLLRSNNCSLSAQIKIMFNCGINSYSTVSFY